MQELPSIEAIECSTSTATCNVCYTEVVKGRVYCRTCRSCRNWTMCTECIDKYDNDKCPHCGKEGCFPKAARPSGGLVIRSGGLGIRIIDTWPPAAPWPIPFVPNPEQVRGRLSPWLPDTVVDHQLAVRDFQETFLRDLEASLSHVEEQFRGRREVAAFTRTLYQQRLRWS
jgi:hypothetical protein